MRGFGAISLILENVKWAARQKAEEEYSPADTDNEVHLSLCGDVEVARRAGCPLQTDLLLLSRYVLLHILLRALEDDLALGLGRLRNESALRSSQSL